MVSYLSKYRRYRLLLAIVALTAIFKANGGSFTLTECEQAAENGVFLAQSEMANLYFTGKSSILGNHHIDYSKSCHYSLLAVYNAKATGSETRRLKSIHMAQLAEINSRIYKEGKSDEYKREAFFWAYAALTNGLNKGEHIYARMVDIAAKGLRECATLNNEFISEYLFLIKDSIAYNARYKSDYDNATKMGFTPSNGLNLKQRRNFDGSFKYIGQLSDGKAHGFGIHMGTHAYYFGCFSNGKYSGEGCLIWNKSGNIMIGEWRNHQLYNGTSFEHDVFCEPSTIYQNGKDQYPRPTSLNIGTCDKRGGFIPEPVDLNLGVRWAGMLMGTNDKNKLGDIYRWGSTNPNHLYQSKSQELPYYLPRQACLAIYGGTNRNTDISTSGYDAPHTLWSSAWRLPTLAEIKELINKCNISIKNDGEISISRSNGNINNSIKLMIPKGTDGYGIWTGSIDPNDNNKSFALIIDVSKCTYKICPMDRECGFAILPVTDIPFLKYNL